MMSSPNDRQTWKAHMDVVYLLLTSGCQIGLWAGATQHHSFIICRSLHYTCNNRYRQGLLRGLQHWKSDQRAHDWHSANGDTFLVARNITESPQPKPFILKNETFALGYTAAGLVVIIVLNITFEKYRQHRRVHVPLDHENQHQQPPMRATH